MMPFWILPTCHTTHYFPVTLRCNRPTRINSLPPIHDDVVLVIFLAIIGNRPFYGTIAVERAHIITKARAGGDAGVGK
jgi:hypothetical protein